VHALLGGDHKRALKAYAAALKIRQELAAGSPGDALQRELALSHERTGDAYLALGYPGPARGHYEQGFAIREKLVLAAPDNTEWQGDLAYSYDRQGRTEPEGEQSLQAFERSAEIREGLVCTEPQDVFWLRDLATSYDQVGDKLRQLERDDERLEYLRKSVAVRETLAQRNPDVASQVALARSLERLGQAGDSPEDRFRRALAIVTPLALSGEDDRLRESLRTQMEHLSSEEDRQRPGLRGSEFPAYNCDRRPQGAPP
jgi:tetratricopeptide (TPR) repeat protein